MSIFREGFDPENRLKLQQEVTVNSTDYLISTVDMGIDHSFGGGPPLYYETMIFIDGDWNDLYMMRYSTEEEARAGHIKTVEAMQREIFKIEEHSIIFEGETK